MSNQAQNVELANFLALTSMTDTQLDAYYVESVLALQDSQVQVAASIIEVGSGVFVYDWPEDCIRILTAFYANKELTRAPVHQLDLQQRDWRSETGIPVHYVLNHEAERTVRLYPIPLLDGDPVPFPTDFGSSYPDGNLVLLYVTDNLDVPDWLDLPIACAILAKEFSRESSHCDKKAAELYLRLATVLRGIGGPP